MRTDGSRRQCCQVFEAEAIRGNIGKRIIVTCDARYLYLRYHSDDEPYVSCPRHPSRHILCGRVEAIELCGGVEIP
jgi:hypothetical protein